MFRRTLTTIQTTSARRAGGHTQLSTVSAGDPNAMRARPPAAMKSAGPAAQLCGWWLNRRDSSSNVAQPAANPQSTAPVIGASWTGMNGAATRSPAARSPVIMDAETIQPSPFGSWLLLLVMVSSFVLDGMIGPQLTVAPRGWNHPGQTAGIRTP